MQVKITQNRDFKKNIIAANQRCPPIINIEYACVD